MDPRLDVLFVESRNFVLSIKWGQNDQIFVLTPTSTTGLSRGGGSHR